MNPKALEIYAILNEKHEITQVTMNQWAKWFAETTNRRVAETSIPPYYISTVFLGIDHGFWEKSLWFETMIFIHGKNKDILEDPSFQNYQERYETWEEALEGHEKAVQLVKEKLK